ncbi:MAG: sulfite exporter TauE/SafE family protein [Magnetococcales bacterium]|nr:sulfite exporter TauE/SafE family protein [Magnetococcales bacterium]
MIPSLLDLWLTFLTALLASGHCIGMCGGLVAAYSLKLPRKAGFSLFVPHLLYGAGRLSTYMLLGAVSGWVGSLSLTFDRPQSLQGVPYLLAGGIMVWMGLGTAGLNPLSGLKEGGKEGGFLIRLTQRVMAYHGRGRTFFLGIMTGLLPCTLHWAFQAKAMAVGSIGGGAAILLAFGLGTLPALWGFGLISTWLSQHARQRLLQGAGLVIVLMGLMTIKQGLS